MWTLLTSEGMRVDNIKYEQDARRTVHRLGVTQWDGINRWLVVAADGHKFTAEIRHGR